MIIPELEDCELRDTDGSAGRGMKSMPPIICVHGVVKHEAVVDVVRKQGRREIPFTGSQVCCFPRGVKHAT